MLCSSNAPAGTRDQYPDLPDAKLVAALSNTRPHQIADVHLEDSVFALRLTRTHRRGSARAAARCGAVAPRGREVLVDTRVNEVAVGGAASNN